MLGGMPAAPDAAPRPRLAPWLIGGALVPVVVAALAGAAWFMVPRMWPTFTIAYSPWISPVMRAELVIALVSPGGLDGASLANWTSGDPSRVLALSAYLQSPHQLERILTLHALSYLRSVERPSEVDMALCKVLHDPDPHFRRLAVIDLTDAHSIPALEAIGRDPDPDVADAVAKALLLLRRKAAGVER